MPQISGVPSVAESIAKSIDTTPLIPKQCFQVLGLTGYKQSGKNTAANLIHSNFSTETFASIRQLAFADAIKIEVAKELGISYEDVERLKSKIAMRKLLQFWGTEYGRDTLGENVWVDKVRNKIFTAVQKIPAGKLFLFIITDVRYKNEEEFIRSMNGALVRVERKDSNMGNMDTHRSESDIDKIRCDFTLPNHGKLADLKRECLWITDFLREKWKL